MQMYFQAKIFTPKVLAFYTGTSKLDRIRYTIPDGRQIRHVRMLMSKDGLRYQGVHFADKQKFVLGGRQWTKEDTSESFWTLWQEVPEGEQIVGFKAYEGLNFLNLSFVLAKIDSRELSGDLKFPAWSDLAVYPSLKEYAELHKAKDYTVDSIKLLSSDEKFLSGIQLVYTNGSASSILKPDSVTDEVTTSTLQLKEEANPVRFISQLLYKEIHIAGLKMLDGDQKVIAMYFYDQEGPSNQYKWTDNREISENYRLVGVKCNTLDNVNGYLT